MKSLILLVASVSLAATKSLYDPVKSYVTILNNKNWDGQVTKNRVKGISIVHFYKESGKSFIKNDPPSSISTTST